MYAIDIRTEAAQNIGIENIRQSKLEKLKKEKMSIGKKSKERSRIYPDFKPIILIRLEA